MPTPFPICSSALQTVFSTLVLGGQPRQFFINVLPFVDHQALQVSMDRAETGSEKAVATRMPLLQNAVRPGIDLEGEELGVSRLPPSVVQLLVRRR